MDDFRNLPFVRAVIGIQSYNIGCDAIAQFIFCIYSFVRYHCINILFDMIGTAVQSAEEKPFHSLAARKVKGARESISVIRHAPQLANLCCDVIGDIAGIISGANDNSYCFGTCRKISPERYIAEPYTYRYCRLAYHRR